VIRSHSAANVREAKPVPDCDSRSAAKRATVVANCASASPTVAMVGLAEPNWEHGSPTVRIAQTS
jgi:hypothetical protein